MANFIEIQTIYWKNMLKTVDTIVKTCIEKLSIANNLILYFGARKNTQFSSENYYFFSSIKIKFKTI